MANSMTQPERKAAMAELRETVEAHDAAALSHMRDARKHLRRATQLSERLEQLSRPSRGQKERCA